MGLPGISYGNVTKITSFCKLILLWGLVKIIEMHLRCWDEVFRKRK